MSQFTCFQIVNFLVWAYRRLHPQWDGRELLLQQAGQVAACSEGLAELGVQPGMAWESGLALAQPHAPQLQVVEPHRVLLVWEELLEELYQATPFLLPLPFQACWAQLDSRESQRLAAELCLAAGIAADRDTAQLAALASQPGQCLSVDSGQELALAARLPLPVLAGAGVSWASLERLHWLGFSRVGELSRLTETQLTERFSDGDLLFRLSRPGCRQSLGFWRPPEECLGEALCDLQSEREPLLKLALERAREQLEARLATRVTLELEYEDGRVTRARRWLKAPTSQARKIAHALQPIWKELAEEQAPERIRVRLGGLGSGPRVQTTLWQARMPMRMAVKQVHDRFPGLLKKVAWHPGADGVSEESWSYANP